ncbi:MAG: PDZ domain-containing protein [Gammaproteobacteria bacterium]|nr:PDZ domain-containing protein [Gammaproteobacteria bacterium]
MKATLRLPLRLCATLLLILGAGAALADPPAPPATPPAPPAPPAAPRAPAPPDADTRLRDTRQKQLDEAQRKLEAAASEVARLSTQLSSAVLAKVMPFVDPGHPIIGVQLEPTDGQRARVSEVSPGGPAEEAGIRAGDVIVALNGKEVQGPHPTAQVVSILHDVKPDSRVSVRVLRDGKIQEFTVTPRSGLDLLANMRGLQDLRDFEDWDMPEFFQHAPLHDLELATLTPRLGSYFGAEKGVLVVHAGADDVLKLQDGDVILSIDGRQPTSGSHATRILSSYQPGESFTLHIMRQHKALDLQATLPARPGHHAAHDAGAHAARAAVLDDESI